MALQAVCVPLEGQPTAINYMSVSDINYMSVSEEGGKRMQGYRKEREERRLWRKGRRWWEWGEGRKKKPKRSRGESLPGFLLQAKVTGQSLPVGWQQTTRVRDTFP